MKAFVSWSGGKESALALWRASHLDGVEISGLLTMFIEAPEGELFSHSHHLPANLLALQAEELRLPLLMRTATWETYEETFKQAVIEMRGQGIEAGIFGDIDIEGHRQWVENLCFDTGVMPILPLWQEDRMCLLDEFVREGFKAVLVVTRDQYLGKQWIGRDIDEASISDLARQNIDLCGENGEYHSFVYGGPIFEERVPFSLSPDPDYREGYWFARIRAGRR